MKTKLLFAGIALALNCTLAGAQVLGGNAVGGLGGSLGGGLGGARDISAMGQGSAHGALGADIDGTSLRRTTSDIAGRTTNRARSSVDTARNHSRAAVGTAQVTGRNAIATTQEVGAGLAESTRDKAQLAARSAVDVSQHTGASIGERAADAPDVSADQFGTTAGDASEKSALDSGISGSLGKDASTSFESDNARLPFAVASDASTEGHASASKGGLSADATGSGAANARVGK